MIRLVTDWEGREWVSLTPEAEGRLHRECLGWPLLLLLSALAPKVSDREIKRMIITIIRMTLLVVVVLLLVLLLLLLLMRMMMVVVVVVMMMKLI